MHAVRKIKGNDSIQKRSFKSLFRLLTDFFMLDCSLFFPFDDRYDIYQKVFRIFAFKRHFILFYTKNPVANFMPLVCKFLIDFFLKFLA